MEFRIAPMIIAIANLLFIFFANPRFNTWIPLSALAQLPKVLIPYGLMLALSVGTFFRHSYYSRSFKISWGLVQTANLLLLADYIRVVRAEHL